MCRYCRLPLTVEQKVVVITGASSGIGAVLARELGREGHRLVLAARRESELNTVAAESGDATAVVVDVTHRDEVNRLRDKAIATYGHVDVWVNNAGRGISKKVLELTDEDLDLMMAVNLKSALYGMQAIVPHFQSRNAGHLINISSFLSRVPLASPRAAYSASKAALNILSANLRMDLAATHPNVHVSVVMPGVVSTDFAASALNGSAAPAPGRLVSMQYPDEVADTIIGLIEDPRPEVYTTPALRGLAKRYHDDVGSFEQGLAAPTLAAPNLEALAARLKNRTS